jgi:hypothetical protein
MVPLGELGLVASARRLEVRGQGTLLDCLRRHFGVFSGVLCCVRVGKGDFWNEV